MRLKLIFRMESSLRTTVNTVTRKVMKSPKVAMHPEQEQVQ